jgi:predicted RNA binding protein YcfA (HicA-like mRNA interferase family)
MHIKILVHEAEEGGFWAEVPVLPGCASQGETMDELIANSPRGDRRLACRRCFAIRFERTGARARTGFVKPVSGGRLARAVEQRGWSLLRVNGSHHIYGKSGATARLSIPVHGAKPLKIGLQRHLMKIAGLTEDDLT